jgi:glutathione S-transferase
MHYNYVEMAPSTLVWLLIAGLYFPIPAAAIGLGVIFFRLIYSIGYAGDKGPKGRVIGAVGNDFMILGLFGLSIASGAMMINGNSPVA